MFQQIQLIIDNFTYQLENSKVKVRGIQNQWRRNDQKLEENVRNINKQIEIINDKMKNGFKNYQVYVNQAVKIINEKMEKEISKITDLQNKLERSNQKQTHKYLQSLKRQIHEISQQLSTKISKIQQKLSQINKKINKIQQFSAQLVKSSKQHELQSQKLQNSTKNIHNTVSTSLGESKPFKQKNSLLPQSNNLFSQSINTNNKPTNLIQQQQNQSLQQYQSSYDKQQQRIPQIPNVRRDIRELRNLKKNDQKSSKSIISSNKLIEHYQQRQISERPSIKNSIFERQKQRSAEKLLKPLNNQKLPNNNKSSSKGKLVPINTMSNPSSRSLKLQNPNPNPKKALPEYKKPCNPYSHSHNYPIQQFSLQQQQQQQNYYVDEQGFLMDQNGSRIIDELGQYLQINIDQLNQLRNQGSKQYQDDQNDDGYYYK